MSRILSPLLSTRENGLLFNLLSHDCSVLACGVVQLLMASPPLKKQWESHSFGVLCLVQDKSIQSTFMRLYCINKKVNLLWEQELYTPFEYVESCPYFHTFPGDECQIGLNFADEGEAKHFYITVQKQINDSKASHSVLTRRFSMGAVFEWKEKLDNILRGNELQKSRLSVGSVSRLSQHLDSVAVCEENQPNADSTISSQMLDSPQTFSSISEESMSLARRKGPLPPLPLHARTATQKLNRSASMQNCASTSLVSSWVPPPPSYRAPAAPVSPVKNPSTAEMKKRFQYNAGHEDESGYDDYL